jgi:hypothetical protein
LKVVDQSLNNDIGIFKLFLALINNGKTIIYSELFNSGDTLKGLYDDPDIRYQLFLSHPDYIKPQPVFLPDQISGGTCLVKLERANTFNLFYVDFSGRSKMALKKVLKKRVEEMTLHHQKFYMIVCNGNSPLEIRDDKEFAAFSSNIGKFYSDPPDPVFMDQWIRTTLDLETIPKDAIFNVTLFLAGQTYRQSGQKIRDGLTSFLDFFSIDPNVIFYLDETIPDKEKITGSLYYNIARITETN